MKKLFGIIAALLLSFTLIACGKKEDAAQAFLDNAHKALDMVITEPSAIGANFQVPVSLADGVSATWESTDPGIVAIGNASGGFVNIIVNRPTKGSGNATVTLKATLSVKSANSDEMITKEWSIVLTILEQTVEELTIETIADILAIKNDAYDPQDKKDKVQVTIENVTIIGKGDVAFGYDGTGTIQLYGGVSKDLEVGKVYTVSGLLEWYFGIWEIIDVTADEQAGATPEFPEKVVITSVEDLIDELVEKGEHVAASGSAKDGNFEPIYASVKGYVHLTNDNASDNYNTYLVDSEYDLTKEWVGGEAGKPARGLLFYYGTSNFSDIRARDGFEVTIDVIIYTYRSNNQAFAVYYIGGKDGIVLGELTDQQKVDLDKAALSLPLEVLASADEGLNLVAEGAEGSTITWELVSDHASVVDIETGKVTIPETGQVEVEIKATITSGDKSDTKTFKVWVGAAQLMSIEDAKDVASGRTIIIEGVVTAMSGDKAIQIEDATGAMVLYGKYINELDGVERGTKVKVKGVKDNYKGLQQVKNYEVVSKEASTVPAAVNLDAIEKLDAGSLLAHQSKLVSLSNMKVTKVTVDEKYGNVTFEFERVDGQKINFYWDSRVEFEGSEALSGFKVGDYVNIVAAPLSWSDGPRLSADAATQVVEAEELSDEVLVAAALDALEVDPIVFTENGTLELADKSNGLDVVWTLKNESDASVVNLETGAVTVSEGFKEVVIVATITKGAVTDTKEFTLRLGVKNIVVTHDISFSTLATTTSYPYEPTDTSVTNSVDNSTFVFLRYLASTNKQADHESNGVALGVRSSSSNPAEHNWGSPYLATKNKVEGVQKVEFTVVNWGSDAFHNINYATAINIEVSENGTDWTLVKDFKSTWDTESNAVNVLTAEINNPEAKDLYVRLIVVSAGPQSDYQLRLVVTGAKFYA